MKKPVIIGPSGGAPIPQKPHPLGVPPKKAFPNLAKANAVFDPKTDGSMTLDKIGQALSAGASQQQAPTFSPGTQQLLAATKARTEEALAAKERAAESTSPAASSPEPTTKATTSTPMAEVAAVAQAAQQLKDMPDDEYEQLLAQVSRGILLDRQEKEVADKLAGPIDIEAAFLSNKFTQEVTVLRGIKVTFRALLPLELQSIQTLVRKKIIEVPNLAPQEESIRNAMQIIAMIYAFNGKPLPEHLVGTPYAETFDDEIMWSKYSEWMRRPLPVLKTLTRHAGWFEERINAAFRLDELKNG